MEQETQEKIGAIIGFATVLIPPLVAFAIILWPELSVNFQSIGEALLVGLALLATVYGGAQISKQANERQWQREELAYRREELAMYVPNTVSVSPPSEGDLGL